MKLKKLNVNKDIETKLIVVEHEKKEYLKLLVDLEEKNLELNNYIEELKLESKEVIVWPMSLEYLTLVR